MKTILAGLTLVLATGCASYSGSGLQPGIADESQVLAAMGEPALRFRNPDGTAIWAYPRGPLGFDTFMARFTSSGSLVAIDRVLVPEHFARVTPGLGKEEVQRIVGPPGNVEAFPRRAELVWDYRFVDAWGYPSQFSVIFDAQGRVRSTLTWREPTDMHD